MGPRAPGHAGSAVALLHERAGVEGPGGDGLHQALDAQRRGLAHELRVGPEKRAKGFAKTNSKKSKV